MKKGLLILLLLIFTALPALAAPTNTTGPWGVDAAGFKNLSTALASPATAGKTMVITAVMNVGNLTIPADCTVEMKRGGRIRYSGALIINGPFNAGLYECLEQVGSGTVTFTEGSVAAVHPEWWCNNTIPGTTDMTAAVQKAIAAYPNVILPEKWLATSVINITRNNFDIGGNKGRSHVIFNPSGGATAENILFRLYNPLDYPAASHGVRNSRIHHIDFSGVLTNVKRKIAIKVEDGSGLTLDNLYTNINGSWIGQASVGLWLAGREIMSVHTVFFQCERPIVLAVNSHFTPQAAGYDIDMFHLYDMTLIAQANLNYPLEPSAYPCIEVDATATAISLTIDGYQTWNGGIYGLKYIQAAGGHTSRNWKLNNIRWEQGATNGYAIYLVGYSSTPMQNVSIDNLWLVKGGNDIQGIYLDNIDLVTISNSRLAVGTGKSPLDATATVSKLVLLNVSDKSTSRINLSNITERFSTRYGTGGSADAGYSYALFEHLALGTQYKDSEYMVFNNVKTYYETATVANNANTILPTVLTGKSAVITVSSAESMAVWYVTSTTSTKMYGTANTANTVIVDKMSVTINAVTGGGQPIVTNLLTNPQMFVISMVYN